MGILLFVFITGVVGGAIATPFIIAWFNDMREAEDRDRKTARDRGKRVGEIVTLACCGATILGSPREHYRKNFQNFFQLALPGNVYPVSMQPLVEQLKRDRLPIYEMPVLVIPEVVLTPRNDADNVYSGVIRFVMVPYYLCQRTPRDDPYVLRTIAKGELSSFVTRELLYYDPSKNISIGDVALEQGEFTHLQTIRIPVLQCMVENAPSPYDDFELWHRFFGDRAFEGNFTLDEGTEFYRSFGLDLFVLWRTDEQTSEYEKSQDYDGPRGRAVRYVITGLGPIQAHYEQGALVYRDGPYLHTNGDDIGPPRFGIEPFTGPLAHDQKTCQTCIRYDEQIKAAHDVIIFGRTMVGKTRLLNLLFNREQPIGSGVTSTTKDATVAIRPCRNGRIAYVHDSVGLFDTSSTSLYHQIKFNIESMIATGLLNKTAAIVYLSDENPKMEEIDNDLASQISKCLVGESPVITRAIWDGQNLDSLRLSNSITGSPLKITLRSYEYISDVTENLPTGLLTFSLNMLRDVAVVDNLAVLNLSLACQRWERFVAIEREYNGIIADYPNMRGPRRFAEYSAKIAEKYKELSRVAPSGWVIDTTPAIAPTGSIDGPLSSSSIVGGASSTSTTRAPVNRAALLRKAARVAEKRKAIATEQGGAAQELQRVNDDVKKSLRKIWNDLMLDFDAAIGPRRYSQVLSRYHDVKTEIGTILGVKVDDPPAIGSTEELDGKSDSSSRVEIESESGEIRVLEGRVALKQYLLAKGTNVKKCGHKNCVDWDSPTPGPALPALPDGWTNYGFPLANQELKEFLINYGWETHTFSGEEGLQWISLDKAECLGQDVVEEILSWPKCYIIKTDEDWRVTDTDPTTW